MAKAKDNPALERIAAGVASGRAGQLEGTDPWTGKDVVFSWAPVGSSRWGFVSVAPKAEIFAGVGRLRTQLLLVALLVLVAITVVVVLVARRLTGPIAEVTEAAERVSEGDVEVTLTVRSDDEIGRMAAAFDRTVDYLREKADAVERVAAGDLTVDVQPRSERDLLGTAFRKLVEDLRRLLGNVSSTASGVAASSEEMAATSDEAGRAVGDIAAAAGTMAAGAQQQVQKVATVRGSADDAAAAARDAAEQARESAEVAEDAHAVAREGVASVDEMAAAMRALAGSSGSASEAIKALAGKSEQIGSIIETITGISDQTNLLALNAAIEAARAGEQGRGFAVVADEVRKLAEGSQEAAATVAGLIEEIQRDTQAVVGMVEDGARRTDDGTAIVEKARAAFVSIGIAVEDVSARASRIATAAEQISRGVEGIAGGVADVAAVAEQSSASTRAGLGDHPADQRVHAGDRLDRPGARTVRRGARAPDRPLPPGRLRVAARSGRLVVGEGLVERAALVDRHDEQRLLADVAEAVQRVGRHDDHLLRRELDDLVAHRPAPVPRQQQERLGVRVHVQLDEPAGRRPRDEHRDVDARAGVALEQERGRAHREVGEVEPGGARTGEREPGGDPVLDPVAVEAHVLVAERLEPLRELGAARAVAVGRVGDDGRAAVRQQLGHPLVGVLGHDVERAGEVALAVRRGGQGVDDGDRAVAERGVQVVPGDGGRHGVAPSSGGLGGG